VAAAHVEALGWVILARNVRVARTELDLVALEPGPLPTLVVVEVRSRSGSGFGSPAESVDRRKVARLYAALLELRRTRRAALACSIPAVAGWRVDLLTLRRDGSASSWRVESHLRGLSPP